MCIDFKVKYTWQKLYNLFHSKPASATYIYLKIPEIHSEKAFLYEGYSLYKVHVFFQNIH